MDVTMMKLVNWIAPYFATRRQTPTEAPTLAKRPERRDRALENALWEAEALWFEVERLKRQAVIEATTPEVVAAWHAASERKAWSQRMNAAKRAKKTK